MGAGRERRSIGRASAESAVDLLKARTSEAERPSRGLRANKCRRLTPPKRRQSGAHDPDRRPDLSPINKNQTVRTQECRSRTRLHATAFTRIGTSERLRNVLSPASGSGFIRGMPGDDFMRGVNKYAQSSLDFGSKCLDSGCLHCASVVRWRCLRSNCYRDVCSVCEISKHFWK